MMARQLLFFFFVAFLLTARSSDSAKLCRNDSNGEGRFCEEQKSGDGIDGHQVTERSASVGGGHRKIAEFLMDYPPTGANSAHSAPPPFRPSPPPPSTNSTRPLPPPPLSPPTPNDG